MFSTKLLFSVTTLFLMLWTLGAYATVHIQNCSSSSVSYTCLEQNGTNTSQGTISSARWGVTCANNYNGATVLSSSYYLSGQCPAESDDATSYVLCLTVSDNSDSQQEVATSCPTQTSDCGCPS